MEMLELALQGKSISLLADIITAGVGLLMLLVCMLIGSKLLRINIYEAINKVEKNPIAFAIFVTGHFIGAAYVLGSIYNI
jgi:hypothetical protein